MKKIVTLSLLGILLSFLIGTTSNIKATNQTVAFGASWSYDSYVGFNGRTAYSNLFSTTRWHSTTVTIGGGSSGSGSKEPSVESKASRTSGYTQRPYYYYNIW